jgi:PAS domain S-box-containing protein
MLKEYVAMRKSSKKHSSRLQQTGAQKKSKIVPLRRSTYPQKNNHSEKTNLYKSIVENMLVAITSVDSNHRILFVNEAICKNSNIPAEEYIGKFCYELFEKRDCICPHCPGEKAMKTGLPADVITEGVRRDGSRFSVHVLAFPSFGQSGEVTGFYEVVENITEYERSKNDLQKEKYFAESLIETAQIIVLVLDTKGRIVRFNKFTEELTGYRLDEVQGKDWFKTFLPTQTRQKTRNIFINALSDIRTQGNIDDIVTKDGRNIPIEWYDTTLKDSQDNITGLLAIGLDITERKLAEKALQENQEKLKTILDTVPALIWSKDLNGRFLWINKCYADSIGVKKEETTGKTDFDIFPKEQAEKFRKDDEDVHRTLKPKFGLEEPCKMSDGTTGWVRADKLPFFDKAGNVVGTIGFSIDITERKKAEKAFQESEERFSLVFRMNPAAIAITRMSDNRFVDVNKAWKNVTGYTRQEVLGHTPIELNLWVDATQREQMIAKFRQDRTTIFEIDVRRKSGEVCNVLMSAGVIELAGESYLLTMAQDITERKNVEKSLWESQLMLQSVLDTIPVAVFWKDRKLNYLGGNRTWLEETGLKSSEDAVGKSDYDLPWTKEQADFFRQCDRKIIESGKPEYGIIESYHQADGKNAWAKTNKIPLRDTKGDIIGVLGTNEDITEHKLAEEALRKSENKWHSLVNIIPDYIALMDKDANYLFLNHYAKGFSEKDVVGRSAASFIPRESQALYMAEFKSALKNGKTILLEYDGFGDGGTIRKYDSYFVPVIENGQFLYMLVFARDITEHKKAEQKFLDDKTKLKSLASQLTVAEQRERRRIATEIHDNIVQKLAVSKIKIEELLFANQTGQSQKELKDVHEWLCQVLVDIRAMAIDLCSPILYEIGFEKAVAVWLEEEIERKHNITTEFSDDGQPKPLSEDFSMLLFRDVRELLYNVVKHSQADKVTVAISRQDSMIKVIVKDNGVGFDVTEVTASSPIASLGLFSIKERLEYIGGSFKLDSSVGNGCTVTLLAPLKQT